jgi:DNA-binding transcriptional LysR family regulator
MESFAGFEAFARVVETGSFTAAATRLQTAKSSVSDAVRALEERLGVRLLERTTRSVHPTEAGRLLYSRCRRLLDEAEAARAEVQAIQEAPTGRLRVAVPESFAERHVVPGVAAFLTAHPTVAIDLVSGSRHVRLVEEEFDLAIRIMAEPAPTLVVRRIATSRLIIVAAPSYLSAHGTPAAADELVRHRCVGIGEFLPWSERWPIDGKEVAVRSVLVLNTGEGMRAAALAGIGVVPLPEWLVADALAAGQLVRVLPGAEMPASGIYAVYPTNRLLTPVVRAFVEHLVRDLRGRGVPA